MAEPTTRTTPRHPLDPLNAEEFRRAVSILRRDRETDERWRFASIELKEPPKEVLMKAEGPIPREAQVVCWNRDDGRTYKAVVSLTGDRVASWEHHPGEQPNITVDEWHEADETLRADPRVIEALAARGITDLRKVLFDTWAYGGSLIAERHRGMRVGWTDVWYRDAPDSNPYANPVNGLHFVVDLNRMELLEVEDDFVVEKPEVMGEYLPKHVPGMAQHDDVKPLEVAQPEGVSFTLDGHELRWQKWRMRLGSTTGRVSSCTQ
jgi:primary-amine oxidase